MFALYALLKALVLMPALFPSLLSVLNFDEATAILASLISLLSLGVIVAVGVGLWRLSSSLADRLMEGPPPDSGASFDLLSFERVALSILGLYIAINALVWIGMATGTAVSASKFAEGAPVVDFQLGIALLARFLELIIGVTLIVGGRGWARVLHRLRTFGTEA